MVQSFNWAGVRAAVSVIFNPTLAVPHFVVRGMARTTAREESRMSLADIRDINFARLRGAGCQAVVFDKDNCLTAPYQDTLYPTLQGAFAQCIETFGSDKVAVVSNSAGSSDDVGFKEAARLEESLGIRVIRHGTKKPDGGEHIARQLSCELSAVAFVGDRLLTDVVFANRLSMLAILTQQLTEKGDNKVARTIRSLENKVLLPLLARAAAPPPQPLARPDVVYRSYRP